MNIKHVCRGFGCIAVIIILATMPDDAYAYIDPNTGGFFFSLILPFVYGILAAVVVFWKQIVRRVKNRFTGRNKNEN